jgi:hypothetical protein
VSEVQLRLATLAANMRAEFQGVNERFSAIDRRFDAIAKRFNEIDVKLERIDTRFDGVDACLDTFDDWGAMLKDLVEGVHGELTGRAVDLAPPEAGGRKGGGSGSGSGGVPLAS